jgi:acetolactate synthase I/II/III large subunit
MKVSTYIAQFLKVKGVDLVFELQGGMITRIVDEIHLAGGIRIVSMHHEQAAAFAADACARVTNRPSVAIATSGPGATNLITGIGSCYFDSVPAIFITGQVNVSEQKGDRRTRQIGFQETDIVAVAAPLTKAAFAVREAAEIPGILERAWSIALSGRPGPVLIDIPMNVQNQQVAAGPSSPSCASEPSKPSQEALEFASRYLNALSRAERPLVLAGRGIAVSSSREELLRMVETLELPVVTSLLGFDSIHFGHSCRIGLIGTYGNRWANHALGTCDLLLVLGSRLDIRQTGADIASFRKGKRIFHVDIDAAELNNRVGDCDTLRCDLREFFASVRLHAAAGNSRNAWRAEIENRRRILPDTRELDGASGINPNEFVHRLSQVSLAAKVVTTDVGNNQMWALQSWETAPEQLVLSSGGMGAMGWALPAAVGACFATRNAPIVSISGDGGFQINIQELQTVVRNRLPIKTVILNNRCLGMIRQFQDSYFDSRYQSTVWDYDAPDFARLASAYGMESFQIHGTEQVGEGLSRMWRDPSAPFLLEVLIDRHTNVYPKMMFGSPITEMEPKR